MNSKEVKQVETQLQSEKKAWVKPQLEVMLLENGNGNARGNETMRYSS